MFILQAKNLRKIYGKGEAEVAALDGECEKYVDSIHLYSSGTKGLILNMISAAGYFTVDFCKVLNLKKCMINS
ncbi:MAG: hypothetical protein ACERKN_16335 [Velocimicrobium sp.]